MPGKRRGPLAVAADEGDRSDALKALRGKLAREIEGAESSRDVAALSRQFTDVLRQIEELTPKEAEEVTPLAKLIQIRGGVPDSSGRRRAR